MTKALVTGPHGPPDISYNLDYDNYLARTQRRLQTEKLPKDLPSGFPQQIQNDLVWDGKDLAEKYDWNYTLTTDDLTEIESALRHFKAQNLGLGFINQDTFPLPNLHKTLRDISKEIHMGHGFKVIRGVPVASHTREENIIMYAGISCHIAPVRGRQSFLDTGVDVALAHVKDMTSVVYGSKIGAPAYTNVKQAFHTDIGDVVALLCLAEGVGGGESYLSSSWKVYNELAATRPDLIHTLSEYWAADTFGKIDIPYWHAPLLYHEPAKDTTPERVILHYSRRTFTGYLGLPRSANIPRLTEAQAEALDALHFTAEKYALSLDFRQGDIQYINNFGLFHGRASFQDSKEKQRHLIRIWLRDPEYAWEIPEPLRNKWDRVYKDVRPENTVFPLEPPIATGSDSNPGGKGLVAKGWHRLVQASQRMLSPS
ncbi:hypothetical protein QC761_401230 [Podospora bellae-mahoneyi]|uniref:TauD/TfdA-like domain-containing protein n=1 Tax=Podospora bellae-mahoneyi TaxID=2093777 RepID=A0ABR0FJ97_9PEZI|nr:hypothetical protein QC761_401230 [Podospora bellae-mahoneyi]